MEHSETYLLLLLADSNLPTGSFVASSGLESYVTHGFPLSVVDFLRDSLASYARSALPFVADAHRVVQRDPPTLDALVALDQLYHTTILNHVTRRASVAQGVALLTLYSKGFSCPPALSAFSPSSKDNKIGDLLAQFKLKARREETHAHLPICWGALTAALGLPLERAQYLHLFLHARGLLSAAVRMNDLGPYGAQQILLHAVQPIVAHEAERCAHLRTGTLDPPHSDFVESQDGPANTWPLGEILAARHDLLHSRIFNS